MEKSLLRQHEHHQFPRRWPRFRVPTSAAVWTISRSAPNAAIGVLWLAMSALLIVSASGVVAQTYTARTDLKLQPYPNPIPCPATSCRGGGSLTGANTIITPSDFSNPIIRITDVNTANGANNPRLYALDSSAEVNFMSKNDDRFFVSDGGGNMYPFVWNPAMMQATRMYAAHFRGTNGMVLSEGVSGFPAWSYTQPYIAYDLEIGPHSDLSIYSYDFASTTKPPKRQLVVDLAACVRPIAGLGIRWNDGVTVSGDDQTFATAYGTGPQDSSGSVYAIVWNRTNGCRAWNTSTGAVTGAYGGAPTGTISDTIRFTLHNGRLSKDGNWMKVGIAGCLGGSCAGDFSDETVWNVATLTVNVSHFNSAFPWNCGHATTGYSVYYNSCGATNPDFYAMFLRTFANMGAQYGTPQLPEIVGIQTHAPVPNPISDHPYDLHASWANNSGANAEPIFLTTWNGQLAPRAAWDNEIIGVSTTGKGTVYRFAHTYATNQSQFFNPNHAIGSVSQSGRWFAWSTDWDGRLGNTSLRSNSCSLGRDCRADVFMTALLVSASEPK